MESKLQKTKDLTYGYVEVFERMQLGIGCYGKVYKAKCGQLPCVAKVFHHALFKFDPVNEQSLSQKVEKDCKHLSSIKHPHLVTYLGFIRDAKSKKLLLLMEAMDENLTDYLERIPGPVPLSKQLSFSYDVALGLSYLHSIKCIHKNLSSNNVLLIAGRRAKVSDYGINLFANFGTIQVYPSAYMPPEIRREPSHYTCKTDTFSFGVLAVQIATKYPPEPTPVTELLDSTTGEACSECQVDSNECQVDSSEAELTGNTEEIHRRKNDIDKMSIDHPVMPLILNCLNDKESLRPSANELCQFIETIIPHDYKEPDTPLTESSTPVNKTAPAAAAAVQPASNRVAEETIIDDFKNKLGQLLQELSDRNDEIADRDGEIKLLDKLLKEKTDNLSKLEKLLSDKNEALGSLQRKKSTRDKDHSSRETNGSGNDGKKAREEGKKSDGELKRKPTKYASQKSLGHLPLQWSSGQPAPRPVSLYLGSAAMDGTRAYISLVNQIYTYTTPTSKWIRLPECSQCYFSLAVVKGQVVVIGGIQGCQAEGGAVNTLKSLAPNKIWDEYLPPMPTKRAFAASITTSDHLVVAGGGETPNSEGLSVVEVLLLGDMQWSTAISLPTLARFPQLVTMDTSVYLFNADSNRVYSCPLQDILQSSVTNPPAGSRAEETEESVNHESAQTEDQCPSAKCAEPQKWKKLCNLPFIGGTKFLSEGGMILGFGGHDNKYRPSKTIIGYNAESNSWKSVGLMVTPRWGALAVSLPNKKIMIVGGNTSIQDTIRNNEIASLIHDT